MSNKDFTKEFTTRIHERCQLGQITYQKAATVLDPTSGKISTILAIDNNKQKQSSILNNLSATIVSNIPAKKPSYLNLACCVNGYSNLTTYDSKFRQNINKSREVSPIRPITHTLQYNRNDGNYLVVPIPVALRKDSLSPTNNFVNNMDNTTLLSPDKRYYSTPTKRQQTDNSIKVGALTGQDCTDNVTQFYKTKLVTPSPTTINNSNGSNNNSPKSFIQQRVERLYGPGALAQAFYSPARVKNNLSILSERSQNNVDGTTPSPKMFKSNEQQQQLRSTLNDQCADTKQANSSSFVENEWENVNTSIDEQSLPVLRHLRPEFRAQLPILSPKRATKLTNTTVSLPQSSLAINSLPTMITNSSSSSTSSSSSSASVLYPHQQISYAHQQQNQSKNSCVVNGRNSSNLLISVVLETVSSSVNNMTLSENNINGCNSANNNNIMDKNSNENKINNSVKFTGEENIKENILKSTGANYSIKNGCNSVVNNSGIMHNNKNSVVTNGNVQTLDCKTKDGNYFLNIIKIERDRLLGLALDTENDMEILLQVYYLC